MDKNNVWNLLNSDIVAKSYVREDAEELFRSLVGCINKQDKIVSQCIKELRYSLAVKVKIDSDLYNSAFVKNGIKEMQSTFVVDRIQANFNVSLAEAAEMWYKSKTRKELMLVDTDYTFVSPARCYDEFIMEKEGNPRWMLGAFE